MSHRVPLCVSPGMSYSPSPPPVKKKGGGGGDKGAIKESIKTTKCVVLPSDACSNESSRGAL